MNIPTLRFPEFNGEWKTSLVHDLYKTVPTNSYSRNDLNYISGSVKNIHYGDIHVKFNSHLKIGETILPFINENLNYHRYTTESYCANGDIILADASEDVKDIGKSIEILNVINEKILAGLHTIHLKPINKAICVGFGGHLFRTRSVVKQIQKESQGAKVLGISGKKILKLNLSYPQDEKEQQKIADFLQQVDSRLKLLKEKKTLLEQYKKAVMEKIFSQELRFKDNDGINYPDWTFKTLKEICLKIQSGGTPLSTNSEYYNGKIPFLSIADMTMQGKYLTKTKNSISEEGLKNSSSWLVPTDSIIYSMYASVGFVSINKIPLATSQAVLNIILKKEYYNEYIYYYLSSIQENLTKYITTGTQGNLNAKTITNFIIPVPEFNEQKLIADFLAAIDKKIYDLQAIIDGMETWKKELMQQMFV